jgi:hypothetical protein
MIPRHEPKAACDVTFRVVTVVLLLLVQYGANTKSISFQVKLKERRMIASSDK